MNLETDPQVAVQRTANLTAGIRAQEQEMPDCFLFDPYAALLAGSAGIAQADAMRRMSLSVESIIVRGRLGDEATLRAVSDGITQAVCLGAGYDTRAWRLDLPSTFRYIEVDLPGVLHSKEAILASAAGSPDL